MSGLQNALSKLNLLYQKKKDQLNEEQVKKAEEVQQTEIKGNQLQYQQVTQQKQQQIQQTQSTKPDQNAIKEQEAKDKKREERRRKKICLRKCAGDVWEDPTLADWNDGDYRLFCGNLGNEVSDEVLANAFRKYTSFTRSRVIRDKRTMKTKGYGFVSFMNPNDYLRAFNEMNNKYVGNRPIKIIKGKWQDRSLLKKKNDGLSGNFIKPKIAKLKRVNLNP